MTTEYRLVSAVMNNRFRFTPPHATFDTASGTTNRPVNVPSGS